MCCLASLLLIAQSTIAQDSLIMELRFDGDLLDNSVFMNNGQPLSSPIYVDGYCGEAIKIGRNINDGVIIDGDVIDGLNDLTISAYVRLDDFSSNNNLLSCSNSVEPNDFILGYNDLPDSFIDGWHIRVENEFYFFEGDNFVSDRNWHFIVLVKEGNMVSFYVDGIPHGVAVDIGAKTLQVDTNGFILGQDQDCVGGCFNADQTWNGLIDDFKIFNKALFVNQIIADDCTDCNGIDNGTAVIDQCGECLEPTDPDFDQSCVDCAGEVDGTSVIDMCGECLEPTDPDFDQNCVDCAGVVDGSSEIDQCGECLEPTDPDFDQSCIDCAGVIDGSAIIDLCGECLEPTDSDFDQSCIDCAGVLNGGFVIDACGECLDPTDPEFAIECIVDKAIYIPNVIVINQDMNGEFRIFPKDKDGVDIINHYRIYDRWGNLVYDVIDVPFEGFEAWWDGSYNNDIAEIGCYTYIIELSYINSEICSFVGSVTLLK